MASRLTVSLLLLILFGNMAVLWIPVPTHTALWKAFNNFCHVPLFGGMAIILLYLARQLGEPRGWSVGSHYGMAFIGAVLLGVVSEGLQLLSSSRYGEWSDLLLDVLGSVCALGLYATYDRNLTGSLAGWRQAPRKYMVHAGVGLLVVVALSPVLTWAYAYWDRAARFPSLCQFSSAWEMMFVRGTNSELQIVPPPIGWKKSRVDTVGHVVFHPKKYPGIRVDEPYPDWRGFEEFSLEVYSELSGPQELSIRIDDAHHNQEHADRFNRGVIIKPGLNHIQIPLEEIRQAPVGREMDLAAIKTLILFAVNPPEEFSLYIDNLRLE